MIGKKDDELSGSHKAVVQLCNTLGEMLSIPAYFSVSNEIMVS